MATPTAPPLDAPANPGAATSSSNPGGGGTYGSPGTNANGEISLSSNPDSLLSGLAAPAGTPPANAPNAPKDWDSIQIPTEIAGSPAQIIRGGKGRKAPDITRLSDLVKLVAAIAQGQALVGFDPQVLADVFKAAKLTPAQINSLTQGGPMAAALKGNNPAAVKVATAAAWKDITTHLGRLGVNLKPYPGLEQPPNAANAMTKLDELSNVSIEGHVKTALQSEGYDAKNMHTVAALVSGHDAQQFATGAPNNGTPETIPGVTAHAGTLSAAALYDQFVQNWKTSESFRTSTTQSLVSLGLIDTSGGAPTIGDVAGAYAGLIQKASENKISLSQQITKLQNDIPQAPGGGPITAENVNQAYVMHYADQIIGPGIVTPEQANMLAGLSQKAGTSTPGTDIITQGIESIYQKWLQAGNAPVTTGSSYAALAYHATSDALNNYGIPHDDALVANLVANPPPGSPPGTQSVLQTGVASPYQLNTLAQVAAEGYAKEQAPQLYGEGVGSMVKAGAQVNTLAAPYLATASSLLGVPTTEMNIADPTGKWMKWSQGGTGPGGTMTQQEWATYLMESSGQTPSNPDYGYANSTTAKATVSNAASTLLGYFGKVPNTSPTFQAPPGPNPGQAS